jgi:hypothetical protein
MGRFPGTEAVRQCSEVYRLASDDVDRSCEEYGQRCVCWACNKVSSVQDQSLKGRRKSSETQKSDLVHADSLCDRYRGIELEALLDLPKTELITLFPARYSSSPNFVST